MPVHESLTMTRGRGAAGRGGWPRPGWLLLAGLLLLAPACAPALSPTVEAQALAAQVVEENYLLGPGDEIEISVWKEPELTKKLMVRPDGRISYPLIGELQAAGRTVNQLREEVGKGLEKFVTDAQVTVILLQAHYYKIYVLGKVNKPGAFVAAQPATVMHALALAGGLTPFASPGRIVVLRRSGDREELLPFDYKAVSRGESLEQNRVLAPGDVVVVP